jgi:hypothetical protein
MLYNNTVVGPWDEAARKKRDIINLVKTKYVWYTFISGGHLDRYYYRNRD